MSNKLDRFSDYWMNRNFPDRQQEEPAIYDDCAGCNEPIYINDEYYEIYGLSVHECMECVLKAVEARLKIASDE